MIMKNYVIAIDGVSSAGKSTLAKQLAKELGFTYIDSGAMYRAVTLYALKNNIIGKNHFDKDKLKNSLKNISISFELDENNNPITYLNNNNVEEEIREIKVADYVSIISKISEVRDKMIDLQRKMCSNKSIVMDGRDIGTVVFPDADVKFYLTADVDERARRRYQELKKVSDSSSFEEIKKNIENRDKTDRERTNSPLKKAKDGIIIDSSNMTAKDQLSIALKYLKEKNVSGN